MQDDERLSTTFEEQRVPARWGWVGEKGVLFTMRSTFLGRVGDKRRIELPHFRAAAFRACHRAGFMFLQRQDQQRFLPAVQTCVIVHGHEVPLSVFEDASFRFRYNPALFGGLGQPGEEDLESVDDHRDFYGAIGERRWTVDA